MPASRPPRSALSLHAALRSRSAVLRYRGAVIDVPKVAAELGVKAVLEGSVRRSGDRVRITVQLISSADGFQLWAERYDRTLQDRSEEQTAELQSPDQFVWRL